MTHGKILGRNLTSTNLSLRGTNPDKKPSNTDSKHKKINSWNNIPFEDRPLSHHSKKSSSQLDRNQPHLTTPKSKAPTAKHKRVYTFDEKIQALGKSGEDIHRLAELVYKANGKSVPKNLKPISKETKHDIHYPKDTGFSIPAGSVFYACLINEARLAFKNGKLAPDYFKDVVTLYTTYWTSDKRTLTEQDQKKINKDIISIDNAINKKHNLINTDTISKKKSNSKICRKDSAGNRTHRQNNSIQYLKKKKGVMNSPFLKSTRPEIDPLQKVTSTERTVLDPTVHVTQINHNTIKDVSTDPQSADTSTTTTPNITPVPSSIPNNTNPPPFILPNISSNTALSILHFDVIGNHMSPIPFNELDPKTNTLNTIDSLNYNSEDVSAGTVCINPEESNIIYRSTTNPDPNTPRLFLSHNNNDDMNDLDNINLFTVDTSITPRIDENFLEFSTADPSNGTFDTQNLLNRRRKSVDITDNMDPDNLVSRSIGDDDKSTTIPVVDKPRTDVDHDSDRDKTPSIDQNENHESPIVSTILSNNNNIIPTSEHYDSSPDNDEYNLNDSRRLSNSDRNVIDNNNHSSDHNHEPYDYDSNYIAPDPDDISSEPSNSFENVRKNLHSRSSSSAPELDEEIAQVKSDDYPEIVISSNIEAIPTSDEYFKSNIGFDLVFEDEMDKLLIEKDKVDLDVEKIKLYMGNIAAFLLFKQLEDIGDIMIAVEVLVSLNCHPSLAVREAAKEHLADLYSVDPDHIGGLCLSLLEYADPVIGARPEKDRLLRRRQDLEQAQISAPPEKVTFITSEIERVNSLITKQETIINAYEDSGVFRQPENKPDTVWDPSITFSAIAYMSGGIHELGEGDPRRCRVEQILTKGLETLRTACKVDPKWTNVLDPKRAIMPEELSRWDQKLNGIQCAGIFSLDTDETATEFKGRVDSHINSVTESSNTTIFSLILPGKNRYATLLAHNSKAYLIMDRSFDSNSGEKPVFMNKLKTALAGKLKLSSEIHLWEGHTESKIYDGALLPVIIQTLSVDQFRSEEDVLALLSKISSDEQLRSQLSIHLQNALLTNLRFRLLENFAMAH